MRTDNYRGWDDEVPPSVDGSTGNTNLPVTPTFDSTTLLGCDLSHYQGSVDFAKLKAAGVEFVIIKATEGSTIVDATFSQFWAAAKAAGIPRSAYHFFRPKSDLQGQIDNFVNTVGQLQAGDLPPVIDVEVPDDWTQLTVAQRDAMVESWLVAVEAKLGVRPIIYINNPVAITTMGSPAYFKNYLLWIAHYTSHPAPSIPAPWTTWTIWQYTETGTIDGVSGQVDLNRFNGSLADLQRLQISGSAAQPAVIRTSSASGPIQPATSQGLCARLRGKLRRILGRLGF